MADTKTRNKAARKPERKSRFSTPVNEDHLEFIKAIEEYKAEKGRPFPAWTEIFQIIHALGYRKVEEPTPITEIKPE